jgi:thiosulfate/3-mercaptopyruvate sulfurtransferase
MNRAGISNRTRVVLYDDQGGRSAARLWYVLHAYGHKRVSIVNGGWKKWIAEKRTITTESRLPPTTEYRPKETPALTCPSTQLLSRSPHVLILDARSAAEYKGERLSPGSKAEGRVPGSINVDWQENVSGELQTFKPNEDLKAMYAAKGLTPDKEIVVYCASGGRASHSLFTLKLLGYPRVKVYYGSFSDYTNRADAPLEK